VGLKSLKSLNLTNGYPNNKKNNKNNKVKSKPLELRSRVKIPLCSINRCIEGKFNFILLEYFLLSKQEIDLFKK
jgi:hypothetical protein